MNRTHFHSYQLIRAIILYRCILAYYQNLIKSMAEAGQVATKEKTITPGPEIASRPEAKKSQPPLCPTLSFEKKSHWAWAKFQYDLRQTGLYYYRARYYDPIMGRFLQTDPKGYYDSLNLYAAFNMNPVNFLDPFGEAIINVFINIHPDDDDFQIQKTNPKGGPIFNPETKTFEDHIIMTQSPDWESLSKLANDHHHTLNIIGPDYFNRINSKINLQNTLTGDVTGIERERVYNSSAEIMHESLTSNDTWTFNIGHVSNVIVNDENVGPGMMLAQSYYTDKVMGRAGKFITMYHYETVGYRTQVPTISKNKYVGNFTCKSSSYTPEFIWGDDTALFTVQSAGTGTLLHNLEMAAYATIKALIMNDPDPAGKGTDALREFSKQNNNNLDSTDAVVQQHATSPVSIKPK